VTNNLPVCYCQGAGQILLRRTCTAPKLPLIRLTWPSMGRHCKGQNHLIKFQTLREPSYERFSSRIIYASFVAALTACHPYGDSASSLGISASTVSQSGLLRSWQSQSGDLLTIGADSSVSERNCATQGSVTTVSQESNCTCTACGSASFTITSNSNNVSDVCHLVSMTVALSRSTQAIIQV